jgi:hypothetical protein
MTHFDDPRARSVKGWFTGLPFLPGDRVVLRGGPHKGKIAVVADVFYSEESTTDKIGYTIELEDTKQRIQVIAREIRKAT